MPPQMKARLTQQRFRPARKSACGLCKPHQRGWAGKRTIADLRVASGHAEQLREITPAFGQ